MFINACVDKFVQEESQKVRAETKLDINLENSRISDMVCVVTFYKLQSWNEIYDGNILRPRQRDFF